MSLIIDSVKELLAGRDFGDPDDAALLLECLAVLVEDRMCALDPAVLQAALVVVEDTALNGQPELAKTRLAWLGYLRAVTAQATVETLELNPN
jgi:hypothetical protein